MTNRPTAGQWTVFDDGRHYYVAQEVIRVTAQKVVTREGAYRERYHRSEAILFFGTKAECDGVVERLTSSAALMREEIRASTERHLKNRLPKITTMARSQS